MPSHLANCMKEHRKRILARNKRLNKLLKSDGFGNIVNYEIKKEVEDVKEFSLSKISDAITKCE